MVKQKIKVLAINTSPRKGRNTDQLLDEVIAGCLSVSSGAGKGADAGSAYSGSASGFTGSVEVEVKRMGVYEAVMTS